MLVVQLLVKLECWPEGVWRCSDDHYFPLGNTGGSLTVVTAHDPEILITGRRSSVKSEDLINQAY